jgi:hypothetical protein
MKGFASASLPRFLRKISLMVCLIPTAFALPLHAATAHQTAYSTSRIPNGLHHAIDEVLGTAWRQTQEVTQTSPGFSAPEFGVSVAVHGTMAMVGAQQQQVNGNDDQGAVFVFQNVDGNWTMTQMLTATDGGGGDTFGSAVAFDGTTAVIGAYGAMIEEAPLGAAYVFTLSDGTWTQSQKLTADDADPSQLLNFGFSVGLSGSTILVGADAATVGTNDFQGAVYVFNETGGTWAQTQKFSGDDAGIGDIFGISLAFDGTNAVVGAYSQNQGTGAAYVFANAAGTFTQTQKLVASDAATVTYFGGAVALSGSTILIGSYGVSPDGVDSQGAAYIFTNTGGTWTQTQQLFADDGVAADQFGRALALDGTTALIDAPGAAGVEGPDAGTAFGAVYVFDGSGGTWTQTQKLYAGDGQRGAQFGWPVTLDGDNALMGSYLWISPEGALQGSAYFFEFGSTPPPTYTIGGTVSGVAGAGLVLQQNGGDNLAIAADGTFTFATPLGNGVPYAVTVLTQPNNPPQTCIVTNGSGTVAAANVTDVEVTCTTTPTFTIGGTVSGLAGSSLVLQNDGGDDLTIGANGNFTFATPLIDGARYAVTVRTQPSNPAQTCIVANAAGNVAGANVDDIAVTCTTDVADRIFANGFESTGGGGQSTTLAETNDTTPIAMNSAACGNNDDGTTSDNQYWRRYYFGEFAVTTAANVGSVDVSIGQTIGAPEVTVTLYTIPHSVAVDTIDLSQLTQIGSATATSPADAELTSINVPITGTIADTVGNDLVVEVATDDFEGQGMSFYIGSTTSPESHPSFLTSVGCGTADPTPTADIGFPDMHVIEGVNITY